LYSAATVIFFSTTGVVSISCEGRSGRKLAQLHQKCGWRFLSWVWYLCLCLFRLILALSRRHYGARTNLSRWCWAGWIVTLGWSSPLQKPTSSMQQQPKQQQQGNSGKWFICIWLDAFCLFQRQRIQTLVPSQWTPGWSSSLCQPIKYCMQQQHKKQQ
jgi:hypothetical protein